MYNIQVFWVTNTHTGVSIKLQSTMGNDLTIENRAVCSNVPKVNQLKKCFLMFAAGTHLEHNYC